LDNISQGPLGLAGVVIEIAVISLIVYVLIGFVRGTRGAGVARGLILLYLGGFIILLFGAHILKLENVSSILENLIGVSLTGAIVIFQPEIRRGLIRLGDTALKIFSQGHATLEKEIADAAVAISKRGEVGALLVIERDTPIGSYIESGVPIDSVINSQLLRTIFTKNTPLHDGAAIIRQGRLAAANCLLPLSENVEVCRGMGTRHRAAIGLAEESDALIVVVSEETGAISVALNGHITKGLDYEGLRALLRKHCDKAERQTALSEKEEEA
jgi:diadenylate cyclase